MTDDTVTPVDITDNQDEFEAEFYGTAPAKQEPVEDAETPEVDNLGGSDDGAIDDNPPAPEETDEDEVVEDEPKPKKKSAKERIDELTAEKHEFRREAEAERRAREALRKEFEDFKASVEKDKPSKELRDRLPDGAPDPDAKGEDGEPLYPLGEFDKDYIRDLTKYSIEQEREAAKAAEAREREVREYQKAQQEIADNWNKNVVEAEKENPNLRKEITELAETFQDIPEAYGTYLANTIMLSELGPQIMSYLSQNIGEAQSIVASGPAAATLALGRLEARLMKAAEKEEKSDKKVSNAPNPPDTRTRGTGGKFVVAPDTDDLDAFEKEFLK
jgi:hypothetical protein